MMKIDGMTIDHWLTKREYAAARRWSVRTLDRYVRDNKHPRGQLIDRVRLGYRASLVPLTLPELEALAKAQPDDGVDREAIAAQMREMGSKGGRRRAA